MTNLSISRLKINPSQAIIQAADYPVAIENRNQIQAYLVGKNLYEKIISYYPCSSLGENGSGWTQNYPIPVKTNSFVSYAAIFSRQYS